MSDQYDGPQMAAQIIRLQKENERLRVRIDAVREIYAGMEGFIPQTAPEAYLLRITKQMYDAALGGEGK